MLTYITLWLALIVYVAFSVGVTFLLLKGFLWLLPNGEKQNDEV